MNLFRSNKPQFSLSKKHTRKIQRKVQVFVRWVRHNPRIVLGLLSVILGLGVASWIILTYKLQDRALQELQLRTSETPPRITPAKRDSSYYFKTQNQLFIAGFQQRDETQPTVQFSLPQPETSRIPDQGSTAPSIQFKLLGGETEKSQLKAKDQTITYQEIFPNTDLIYSTMTNGLKEEIVLKTRPEQQDKHIYRFEIITSKAILRPSKARHAPIVFDRTDGQGYAFQIDPPFAIDAERNRTNEVTFTIREQLNDQGLPIPYHYSAELHVQPDWLYAEERVYPVRIDPTIVHDTSGEATGYYHGTINNTDSGDLYIENQYLPSGVDIHTAVHLAAEFTNIIGGTANTSSLSVGSGVTNTKGILSHPGFTSDAWDLPGASGAYVSIAGNEGTRPASHLSIDAWVYPRAAGLGTDQAIIYHYDNGGGDDGWGLRINAAGYVEFFALNASGFAARSVTSTVQIKNNRWYHLAGVFDWEELQLYIDGELNATKDLGSAGTTGSIVYDANSTIYIGARGGSFAPNTQLFNGILDEIRVSTTSRTENEIRQLAQKRPWGQYISQSIDLGSDPIVSYNSLSWEASGVNTQSTLTTAKEESERTSTGVVAEWLFNSSSGTTATSGGSCGASCNGTLTSFSATSSVDQAASTGWTAQETRGNNALKFDGSDDYVVTANNSSLQNITTTNNAISLEAWFQVRSTHSGGAWNAIMMKGSYTNNGYGLMFEDTAVNGNGFLRLYMPGVGQFSVQPNFTFYEWYHVVATVDTHTVKMYVNGKLLLSQTHSASFSVGTQSFYMGRDNGTNYPLHGILDTVRLYNIALTQQQVLTNYQTGNLLVQNQSSSNNSTWSSWDGGSSTSVYGWEDNLGFLYDNYTNEGYWPMDETSGTTVFQVNDLISSNSGTATGASISSGKWGNARGFNGSSDYIEIPNSSNIQFNSSYTLEAWIYMEDYPNDLSNYGRIISKSNSSTWDYFMQVGGAGMLYCGHRTAGNYSVNSINPLPLGQWTHVACVFTSGVGFTLYANGQSLSLGTPSGTLANPSTSTKNLQIGRLGSGGTWYYGFRGRIDEVRIHDSALSASSIAASATQGGTGAQAMKAGTSTAAGTYTEGSRSLKLDRALSPIDDSLVGYWPMDETSGSGAYIEDFSPVGTNDGTPTGTTVQQGVKGNARNFNGSSYITVPDSASLDLTTSYTLEAWIYPTDRSSTRRIITKWSGTDAYFMTYTESGNGLIRCLADGTTLGHRDSSYQIPLNKWSFVACVFDGAAGELSVYIDALPRNGTLAGTIPATMVTNSTNLSIGGTNFIGSIDEVRVYNRAKTYAEIQDTFWGSKGTGSFKSLSASVGTAKMAAIDVAVDSPQQDLYAVYGESAYENYESGANVPLHLDFERHNISQTPSINWSYGQADSNTVGMFRFEHTTRDSANNNVGGTWNGTYTAAQGKVGSSAYLNGTTNFEVTHVPVGSTNYTYDAWVYLYSNNSYGAIFKIGNAGAPNAGFGLGVGGTTWDSNSSGANNLLYLRELIAWHDTGVDLPIGWNHVALVMDASGYATVYANGKFAATISAAPQAPNQFIGVGGYTIRQLKPNGNIDEFSVSNTARTDDQIRLKYNFTRRPNLSDNRNAVGAAYAQQPVTENASYREGYLGHGIYYGERGSTTFSGITATAPYTIDAWIKFPIPLGASWRTLFGNNGGTYHYATIENGTHNLGVYNSAWYSCGYDISSLNGWHHFAVVAPASGSVTNFYIDGQWVCQSATKISGQPFSIVGNYATGGTQQALTTIDEVRYSPVAVSQATLRRAANIKKRMIPLFTEFSGKLGGVNSLTGVGDTNFSVKYDTGPDVFAMTHGSQVSPGDKIIVEEKVGSTTYRATGSVSSANFGYYGESTEITVSSWDAGSTFPSGGYTTFARVYKWTTHYIDLESNDRDSTTINNIVIKSFGRNARYTAYIDNFRTLTSLPSSGDAPGSTENRYFRYKTILTGSEDNVSPIVESVTLDYTNNPAPLSAKDIWINGASVPSVDIHPTSPTITFSAVFQDSYTPDTANAIEIQVDDDSDFSSTKWGSGWITLSPNLANGARSANISYAGTSLALNTPYYVRVRFRDASNQAGAWSNECPPAGGYCDPAQVRTPTFRISSLSSIECRAEVAVDDSSITVRWTDTANLEDGYYIARSVNGGAFSFLTTTLINSTSYVDSTVSQGNTYAYRINSTDLEHLDGPTCTTPTVSLQSGTFEFSGVNLEGLNVQ